MKKIKIIFGIITSFAVFSMAYGSYGSLWWTCDLSKNKVKEILKKCM